MFQQEIDNHEIIKHNWLRSLFCCKSILKTIDPRELNSFIDKSNYPVDIVITPPKYWFLGKEKNSEILIYEKLLNDLNSPKIKKKCNLYNLIKSEFFDELYVDGVHLSKEGHDLWSKKLDLCLKD